MKIHSSAAPLAVRGLRGAIAGAAATLPMSVLMLAAQKMGLMGKQPPEKITEAAIGEAADQPVDAVVDEPAQDLLSVINHFAFGAGAGAIFGIFRRRGLPGAPQGVAFGLCVWAVSYKGWVPAVGILPPPDRDRPGRPGSMIAAHVLFGAVLGDLVARSDTD